ncbi:MAG TPA: hypothetical protein PK796_02775 [Bacteroidales bacterium]|jgi:hypothetical protein|nr:hypothetical protein [Bacteroidales bacterium]
MSQIRIIGLHIADRIKEAGNTQSVLARHSRIIRSRLGFHELNEDICSRNGIIILNLAGTVAEQDALVNDLKAIGGLEVREMSFDLDKVSVSNCG